MNKLVALYLILLVHMMDSTIANLALVTICRDLGIESYQGQWIVTTFGLGVGVAISAGSRLSAWLGNHTAFTWALVVSALASAGCALASTFPILVVLRLVQGLATGMISLLSQRLIIDQLGEQRKAFGMSLWSSAISLAPVAGPLVSAAVIQHWSWRWLFGMNPPLILCTAYLLRDNLRCTATGARSPGMLLPILLVMSMLGSIECLLEAALVPAAVPRVIVTAASITLVVATASSYVRTTIAQQPLFNWRLLLRPEYALYTSISMFVNGMLVAGLILYPTWLQVDYGLPLWRVARVIASGGLISGFLSPLIGKTRKPGNLRVMIVVALWLFAASFSWTWTLGLSSSIWDLAMPRVLTGFALALLSPSAYLATRNIPETDFVAANALSLFLRSMMANVMIAIAVGSMRRLGAMTLGEYLASGERSTPAVLDSQSAVAKYDLLHFLADTQALHLIYAIGTAVCLVLSAAVTLHSLKIRVHRGAWESVA